MCNFAMRKFYSQVIVNRKYPIIVKDSIITILLGNEIVKEHKEFSLKNGSLKENIFDLPYYLRDSEIKDKKISLKILYVSKHVLLIENEFRFDIFILNRITNNFEKMKKEVDEEIELYVKDIVKKNTK